MIALQCFVLVVLAAPFKSKSRLEAENAVLRHQLIVLQRKVQRRLRLTNNDRWLFSQLMAILHGDNPPPTSVCSTGTAFPWERLPCRAFF
jgi:hypothetical protein